MAEDHESEMKKVAEMIKSIKFAMLTTIEENGALHSRPMATQSVEFDGDLWFFTRNESPKAWEVESHRQVGVTFADTEKSKFVAMSGTASLVERSRKDEGALDARVEGLLFGWHR